MHALYKCKNDDKNNNETSSNEISLPGNQLVTKKNNMSTALNYSSIYYYQIQSIKILQFRIY